MGIITKIDLYYKDNSWTALNDDDPKITGEPDSSMLNRKEGYEILYFINKLCELFSLKQKSSATKIEKMIRMEVPTDIRSQIKIKNWIKDNWENSNF